MFMLALFALIQSFVTPGARNEEVFQVSVCWIPLRNAAMQFPPCHYFLCCQEPISSWSKSFQGQWCWQEAGGLWELPWMERLWSCLEAGPWDYSPKTHGSGSLGFFFSSPSPPGHWRHPWNLLMLGADKDQAQAWDAWANGPPAVSSGAGDSQHHGWDMAGVSCSQQDICSTLSPLLKAENSSRAVGFIFASFYKLLAKTPIHRQLLLKLLKWVQGHTAPQAPQPEGGWQRGAPERVGLRCLLMQSKLL